WTTTFSINTEGYSRHYGGSSCLDTNWSGPTSPRSLTGIEDSAQRLAITPVRVGGEQFGWMRFFYTDAAWPTVDRYASNFSWSQLVYDARRQYAGPKFIGAYADGHAGKYGREKFVGYVADNPAASDAQTWTRFCEVMTERDLHRFWGYAWSGN
ncbi:MAG: hypothetical protein SFX74_13130, partial [Fimbriimonadaceae bacterium]|nr:hypothetical protein [Fimbriimonadaceae bacterium]